MTETPIEERVGAALGERGATVAAAESATGGLIGSLLTDVPGSSDYFDRSLVTYSYDAKRDVLAVSREALDAHGAVSEPVARQMARGVCDLADTDWGVATTGVAGPGGGSETTPVGTVYVAVANAASWGSGDSRTTVARYVFGDDRRENKRAFAEQALEDLLTRVTAEG